MGTLKLISASCLALLMFYASLSNISKFVSQWFRSRLCANPARWRAMDPLRA